MTAIQAISANPFAADASLDTVRAIRELPAPPGTTARVTGASADFIDFQASLDSHLPVALAIVVLATLVILFLMTGSVVLPVKSLLMNLLNLSAVFGLLVLIFQDGRLEGLLGYSSPGAIEQTMPILMFAVAFGLSTDYAVFLLSRIKEARDGGASDSDAVAIGLERTGRIVTAAALLFAVAMLAFATSKIIFIKENGVGTALAVLIDASIVRALLVPSLMAAARQVELVGAGAAAPAARPDRDQRGRGAGAGARHRVAAARLQGAAERRSSAEPMTTESATARPRACSNRRSTRPAAPTSPTNATSSPGGGPGWRRSPSRSASAASSPTSTESRPSGPTSSPASASRSGGCSRSATAASTRRRLSGRCRRAASSARAAGRSRVLTVGGLGLGLLTALLIALD